MDSRRIAPCRVATAKTSLHERRLRTITIRRADVRALPIHEGCGEVVTPLKARASTNMAISIDPPVKPLHRRRHQQSLRSVNKNKAIVTSASCS